MGCTCENSTRVIECNNKNKGKEIEIIKSESKKDEANDQEKGNLKSNNLLNINKTGKNKNQENQINENKKEEQQESDNKSKKQSIKAFRQAEKAYNKKKSISKRFGRMSYRMNNGKLEINKVNITYDSHESDDDFIRLFGEDRITFSSPKDALEHLKDKYDDQEKYIWDAFEKCAEERAKNMLNES